MNAEVGTAESLCCRRLAPGVKIGRRSWVIAERAEGGLRRGNNGQRADFTWAINHSDFEVLLRVKKACMWSPSRFRL